MMKSFGGARPYIFVDPQHIKDAHTWLAKHQRDDGCIRSVGKLFHNGMKVTTPPPRWLQRYFLPCNNPESQNELAQSFCGLQVCAESWELR